MWHVRYRKMASLTISRARLGLFSLGSVAYGVKDNGFSVFMMIYFNQVLGLDAMMVGLALLIAMSFDAITDPWVGHMSDGWRGRLGRRHPFMYAAILPSALTYFFLWHTPDGLSGTGLFAYLLVMAVLVRLTITFFEVPNTALVGELTTDYDRRTTFFGLRFMVGWVGGITMAVIAYEVYLQPVGGAPGVLNKEGYRNFAVLGAIIMAVAMLISSIGTHRLIPQLPRGRTQDTDGTLTFASALRTLFSHRSFRAVFISSLFANMVFGISLTLQVYFGTFYFGMSADQLGAITLLNVPAAFIAFPAVAWLARHREKRTVTIYLLAASVLFGSLVILGKYIDILPPNGSDAMFLLVAANLFVSTTILIALQIMLSSMTADLVEEKERLTGHRAEGLYLASVSFSRKVVSGLGIFVSGVLISTGVRNNTMDETTMDAIALPYMILISALYTVAIIFLRNYKLSRADHEDNIASLS